MNFQYLLFNDNHDDLYAELDREEVLNECPITEMFLREAQALCADDPSLNVRVSFKGDDGDWYTLYIEQAEIQDWAEKKVKA